MATTLQILRKARKLIEKPGKWGKGDYAFTDEGVFCDWDDGGAACFCMMGAVHRAQDSWDEESPAMMALRRAVGGPLHEWNDAPRRTHAQVLRAFDKAIAKLEAKGKP